MPQILFLTIFCKMRFANSKICNFQLLKTTQMTQKISNFKSYFRSLNIIYYVILMVLLFLMTVVYVSSENHSLGFESQDQLVIYTSLIIGFFIYWFSGFIKRVLSKKAKQSQTIQSKFDLFMRYYILNLLVVEVYGIYNTILFLGTDNLAFLIFAAYAILLLLLMNPKPEKMSYLLHLNSEEQTYINQPEKAFK